MITKIYGFIPFIFGFDNLLGLYQFPDKLLSFHYSLNDLLDYTLI